MIMRSPRGSLVICYRVHAKHDNVFDYYMYIYNMYTHIIIHHIFQLFFPFSFFPGKIKTFDGKAVRRNSKKLESSFKSRSCEILL